MPKVCRLKNEHDDLAIVVVDYLQMMRVDSKYNTREEDLSEISHVLKVLARDINVPVIACSQLSREVERRPDKQPQLSDLRGSGAIGEAADLVVFYTGKIITKKKTRVIVLKRT